MDWQDRISVDPNVLVGKPVIKGTRIAVEFVVELLASSKVGLDVALDGIDGKDDGAVGLPSMPPMPSMSFAARNHVLSRDCGELSRAERKTT